MPILSDTRAPNTTREKMSRPIVSVPNQWSHDGGARNSDVRSANSNGAMSGAKMAVSTSSSRKPSPTIASLLREKRLMTSARSGRPASRRR